MAKKNNRIIGVIPSRYSSTRLPGKPLKDIAGMPMIVHVLKRAQLSHVLDEVLVATDDQRIFDVVEQYGGTAMQTSKEHDHVVFGNLSYLDSKPIHKEYQYWGKNPGKKYQFDLSFDSYDELKRAIIMKEILDKPRAQRRSIR